MFAPITALIPAEFKATLARSRSIASPAVWAAVATARLSCARAYCELAEALVQRERDGRQGQWPESPVLLARDQRGAGVLTPYHRPSDLATYSGLQHFPQPIDSLSQAIHPLEFLGLAAALGRRVLRLEAENIALREGYPAEFSGRRRRQAHQPAGESKQESKARYVSLAAAAPVGIFRTDTAGNCVYVNERWCRITGLTPAAATGESWVQFVRPDDRQRVATAWQQFASGERPFQLEYRLRHPTGTAVWVYGQVVAEKDPGGRLAGYVGTITDITDRKRSENALRKTETLFLEAQRIAHLGNWERDLQRDTLYWSEELFRILGLDPQQTTAAYSTFLEIVHPEDRDSVRAAHSRSLHDGNPHRMSYRLRLGDGRLKYVREQYETILGPEGAPLRSAGTIQDITPCRQAEIALETIVEGTAGVTGQNFLLALVRHLAAAFQIRAAFVSERRNGKVYLRELCLDGVMGPARTYNPQDLPCQRVLEDGYYHCEREAQQQFPQLPRAFGIQAESYLGIALKSAAGATIGHLGILDTKPLPASQHLEYALKTYSARAGAELERMQTARALEKLNQELEQRVVERTASLQSTLEQLRIEIAQRTKLQEHLYEANQELEKLSQTDALTRIANRRRFDWSLRQEWQRWRREQTALSLILFDIDYFKQYNDCYGHQMGDRCLYEISQAGQQAVYRPTDLIARYGGEEFAILLPNTGLQGAIAVTKRLQAGISALGIPHRGSQAGDIVTVSVGIACPIPAPGEGERGKSQISPETLVARADKALYAAKQEGRDRYAVYTPLLEEPTGQPPAKG